MTSKQGPLVCLREWQRQLLWGARTIKDQLYCFYHADKNTIAPRDLNSIKDHKLTRRRVVELATAAGISTAVAANMTVDDVKASDSDQVTISLDCHGERKYRTDADHLEWAQRARRATENIKRGYFGKSGILSVGTTGGKGQENPRVIVTLDENSNGKDERRGELPEEKNGVGVEVRERNREDYNLACSTNCIDEGADFPGGQHIDINSTTGTCTNGSQVIKDGYEFVGWSTAGHCFPECDSDNTEMNHCPDDNSCADYIVGTSDQGGFIDPHRDVGFISYDQDHDISPSSMNLKPSNHNEGVNISGTLSQEGMDTLQSEYAGQNKFYSYGAASCFTSGQLDEMNQTKDISGVDGSCRDELRDQFHINVSCTNETISNGDSGALWFTPDPNTDTWYAVGSLTGFFKPVCVIEGWGAQGFSIYNRHGLAWRA